MKNLKLNINKIMLIAVSGFILITYTACGKKEENNYQSNVIESDYYDEVIHSIKEDEGITSVNNSKTQDKNLEKNKNNNVTTEKTIENSKGKEQLNEENTQEQNFYKKTDKTAENLYNSGDTQVQLSKEDGIIINEFNSIKDRITNYLNSADFENFKDSAKGVFINIVDFIFYDGEIKGIKFNDLTEEGKKQVLALASSIDSMITNKYPTYKEDISTTTKDAYKKASELIKQGAKNISDFSKDKLGEENYNTIKNAKDELVEYSKQAIEIIGNFSSKTWSNVKNKVKNWYEEFRNN